MTENNSIKILVVDDSDIIKYSLKKFFSEYHFEVITSNDGLEGIEKARVHQPKLIFLDLMMPNFDGLKMLQVLKVFDELKEIPVIVISGNTSRNNVLRAIEGGAMKVLSKPLHKEVIRKALKEVLGEELLEKSKLNVMSKEDESEMAMQLKTFFLNNFTEKMPLLREFVGQKNKTKAYEIVHQLKGAGTTAGFPQITEISTKAEEYLLSDKVEWEKTKEYTEALIAEFNEIEN